MSSRGISSKVVSSRVLLAGWQTAVGAGVAPAQLTAETRALVAKVRRTRERIDWDDYIDFLDQVRAITGTREAMARMFESQPDAMPELGRFASLFVSPRQLYRFLVSTIATAGFSHMTSSLEDVGAETPGGTIVVRTVLPPAYRDGTSFFECAIGGLRSLPGYMGLPSAGIEPQISSHEGVYRLTLPVSRTLSSRVEPAMRAALEQLSLYAEELQQLTGVAARSASSPSFEYVAGRFAFTRRQREVAALVVRGASNKDIALQLQCAERTVELHVSTLMRKTRTANRTQLAAVLLSGGEPG
jgi:DNA-binding CsgD family transcriptional regulator